eukprot:3419852-Heterocapsa_arctica.AAC.1
MSSLRSLFTSVPTPLGMVKKMIKDLIVYLMKETNEETRHKDWCNTELYTNEQIIMDAGVAQTALTQAPTVQKKFYVKAGDATIFIQQSE